MITLSLVASKAYWGEKMNGTKLRGVGLIWDKVSLTKCVCVCVCLFVMRVCVCVCDEGDEGVCVCVCVIRD